ncbi:hypothetical protein DFH27DRAFT_622131 [Peziza echinospora]|nr:hypothetical protein DFH27DRAFT_622131 [Peziza echinospora]
MSVVDANLPIFHLVPSRTSPTSESVIAHSQNGSTPAPQYLKRRDPTAADTYAIALRDAHYPDIVYASCSSPALYPQPHRPPLAPSAAGPSEPPDPPKVPAAIPITLYNPTSRVLLRQRPSSWGAGPFWEFSMPKTSFLQPTGSLLDQTVGASRLALGSVPLATFRWRKEGGVLSRSSLRCSLIHPSNVPVRDDGSGAHRAGPSAIGNISGGSGGGKEPDITVAIFTNGISGGKPGKGEITIYEPSLRRVEVEDLKGLEVMLLMSACVIADVWFSDMRLAFNLSPERIPGSFAGPGRTATLTPQQMADFAREDQMVEEMERQRRERIVSPPPVPVEEALPAYSAGRAAGNGYPREKQRPTQGQLLSADYQQRLAEHRQHQELEQQRLALERQRQQQEQQRLDLERQRLEREAQHEAAARRLQAQYEAEARKEQERIDAETARLIQLEMMHERQQAAGRRPGASVPVMHGRPAMPPRPQAGPAHGHQYSSSYPHYSSQPAQQAPQQNHNLQPKKSGWFGGKKLENKDHRKSFMGLRVFGDSTASGSGPMQPPMQGPGGSDGRKEQKKLAKKKSGMWGDAG